MTKEEEKLVKKSFFDTGLEYNTKNCLTFLEDGVKIKIIIN